MFSLITNQGECSIKLNMDLTRIAVWANQWKMSFNPDPSKQAVEVYFSRKLDLVDALALSFNNTAVVNCESHNI